MHLLIIWDQSIKYWDVMCIIKKNISLQFEFIYIGIVLSEAAIFLTIFLAPY